MTIMNHLPHIEEWVGTVQLQWSLLSFWLWCYKLYTVIMHC